MKVVGITQRVEQIVDYDETRDCLDQRWVTLLQSINILPIILPLLLKNIDNYISSLNIEGLILTGGNDLVCTTHNLGNNISSKRDEFEFELINYAVKNKTPLLGVCRGMQLLNTYFDGKLSTSSGHSGSKHEIVINYHFCKFWGQRAIVNSYHKYGIQNRDIGPKLMPFAIDKEGNVEGIKHSSLPINGIMWHPERNNPFDQGDLKFLKYIFR